MASWDERHALYRAAASSPGEGQLVTSAASGEDVPIPINLTDTCSRLSLTTVRGEVLAER